MAALGEPAENIRVVTPRYRWRLRHSQSNTYPEQVLILWAARRSGRKVKWISERSETFLIDYHGRDLVTRKRASALTANGQYPRRSIVDITCNEGAQTVSYVQLHNAYPSDADRNTAFRSSGNGCLRGVVTNTAPIGVLRGAGRPEATLAMERCLDIAADASSAWTRIAIRMPQSRDFQKGTALYHRQRALTYDSAAILPATCVRPLDAIADWKGFAGRKREAAEEERPARRHRSCQFSSKARAVRPSSAPISLFRRGKSQLTVGTQSTGQGHETSVSPRCLPTCWACTPLRGAALSAATPRKSVKEGGGTHSDRSMRLAGAMIVEAARWRLSKRPKKVAAALLEAPVADIQFRGRAVRRQRSQPPPERFSILPKPWRATLRCRSDLRKQVERFSPHVRPHSGLSDRLRGLRSRDRSADRDRSRSCATFPWTMPASRSIRSSCTARCMGGVALGVGQALCERRPLRSGKRSGPDRQFSSITPCRAPIRCPPSTPIALKTRTINKLNPLRVKGGGEGGTTPGPAAILNAICDALKEVGVTHIDMPATPHRVWRAIREARGQR